MSRENQRKTNFAAILIVLFLAVNLSAQTAYVTKSGTKYHRSDCRYLSQSKISMDLDEAIKKGYTPCAVCNPPTKSKTNTAGEKGEAFKTEKATTKSGINPNVKSTQTVYITKTGTKYHTSGCTYLKNSSIPISLEDAIKRGYTPCSVCKPPK